MPRGSDYKDRKKHISELKRDAEHLLRRYGHRNLRKAGIDSIVRSDEIKSEFEGYISRLYNLGAEKELEHIRKMIYGEGRHYFSDVFNKVVRTSK